MCGFLDGRLTGWGPGHVKLKAEEQAELAEITLSWLVLHGSQAHQIDLTHEAPSPELKSRLEIWIALDAREGRVEVRS
jgi:hypothetical protein